MLQAISCPKCAAPLPPESQTCPYCGSSLKAVLPEEPLTGDELARSGVRAYRSEKYEQALAHFEQALRMPRQTEKLEDILTLIGLCHEGAGRYEQAIEFHKKALAANPKHHKAWVNLGITYRKSGNFEQAESCYQAAIKLQPDYAELHASLGALYVFKEEAGKAVAACERAIELNPNLSVAYANLAVAYAMGGRFEMAEEALRKAVLRGYKNYEAVKERLDGLRKLAKANP